MTNANVEIADAIDEQHVHDAFRIAYDAFAAKFRTGFRNADDLTRLFRGSIDRTSCFAALVDGRLAGILTFQIKGQEFYRLDLRAAFTRFSPLRALRVMLNLALLAERVGPDEFVVDSLAIDPSYRGMGIGTSLMRRAESKARSVGKRTMSLGVIGENEGAIRLYERLGYETTRNWRGFLVRLASGSEEVRRMEKPLDDERANEASGGIGS